MEMDMDMEEKLIQQEEEEDLMATRRIFVGGLGEKVTEEDLHKTFSSLGTIKGIEFVRTNGRSFAYLDFKPSTDKSLSKLFSSYNGCVWKGGRLRLEKAKEHYMVRLRREWEEDAELDHKENDEVDASENKDASEIKDETTKIPASIKFLNKSKLLSLEKKQLQIFFPKLRKVKSVPYSGTGKHKYSFQRVEVPSLPIHFCDCEEHCGSFDIPKAKQTSDFVDQTGNVNDEELDMMRSVMNKIFKREGNASTEISNVKVPTEEESPDQSMKDGPSDESEADQGSDADNLVINIVSGGNAELRIMEKGRLKSEPNPAKRLSSSAGSSENKFKAQKEKNDVSVNFSDPILKKKPRLLPLVESNRNEFTSTMPQKKENPENCIDKSRDSIVAQPDKKISKQKFATCHSWGQKSSWKKLVGETAKSSFSISDILPDVKLMKQSGRRSANSEPLELKTVEILQKVSTGDPLIRQNLTKQRKSANFEPVGLRNEEILQDKVDTDGQSSVAPSDIPSKESENPEGIRPADQSASDHQTVGGKSWMQTSSWRELVGEIHNSSFSISHVLPDIASRRPNLQNYNSSGIVNANGGKQTSTKQFTSELTGNVSNDVVNCGIVHDKVITTVSSKPSSSNESGGLEGVTGKVNNSALIRKAPTDVKIAEVCTFMKSDVSVKEWKKTRATLSAACKKKSNEKS